MNRFELLLWLVLLAAANAAVDESSLEMSNRIAHADRQNFPSAGVPVLLLATAASVRKFDVSFALSTEK